MPTQVLKGATLQCLYILQLFLINFLNILELNVVIDDKKLISYR